MMSGSFLPQYLSEIAIFQNWVGDFLSKYGGYKVWICNRVEVRQLEWRRYQYVLFLILALFPFLLVVVFEFATELKSDSWNDGGINIRYFSLRPFHNPKHNLSVKHNLPHDCQLHVYVGERRRIKIFSYKKVQRNLSLCVKSFTEVGLFHCDT